jgi:type I restriction enzyme S subunit
MIKETKFKQTEIGMIPLDWKETTISEMGDVIGGGTPSTKNESFYNGPIAWITPRDLSNHKEVYISKGERNITKNGLKNSSAKLMPKDTVLFTSRAPIGYIAIAKNEVCTNQGFKSIVCSDKANNRFIYYWLKHNKSMVESLASGSTFKEISGSVLKSIKIYLPTIQEQEKIAKILFDLDSKIELLQKQNETLEKIGQTIFKHWFVDFEFPNEEGNPYKSSGGKMVDSELGEIPEGWQINFMKKISDVNWGDTKITKSSYIFQGYETYSASGMDGYRNKYDYDKPGIVLSAIGAYCGKTWLAQGKWSCIKNTIRIFGEKISTYYLYFITKKSSFWKIRGAAQPFLSKGDIDLTKILVPEKPIIDLFDKSIKINFEKIKLNETQIKTLQKTRNILLPKLMNGKIRVPLDK